MDGAVDFMSNAVSDMFDFAATAVTKIATNEHLAIFFFAGLAFMAVGLVQKMK